MKPPTGSTIWTIGHSTRTTHELIAALRAYDIELVADVRRFPGSRRLPRFGSAVLRESLAAAGIDYCWLPALGGRRRPATDSRNTAWRHPSFRGYADHLATEEFAQGIVELLMLATGLRTAVMCAEVLWWRCHRRLIADVLVSLGYTVIHIANVDHAELHRVAAPAHVIRGVLEYS